MHRNVAMHADLPTARKLSKVQRRLKCEMGDASATAPLRTWEVVIVQRNEFNERKAPLDGKCLHCLGAADHGNAIWRATHHGTGNHVASSVNCKSAGTGD